jgi:hypothetical protein
MLSKLLSLAASAAVLLIFTLPPGLVILAAFGACLGDTGNLRATRSSLPTLRIQPRGKRLSSISSYGPRLDASTGQLW